MTPDPTPLLSWVQYFLGKTATIPSYTSLKAEALEAGFREDAWAQSKNEVEPCSEPPLAVCMWVIQHRLSYKSTTAAHYSKVA